MDIDKLVKMANQIAANSDYGTDKDKVAAVVADHLTRFWTPAMRRAIIESQSKNLIDLSPVAARAVEKLVPPPSGA
jgi:formate dehydrogenase subunit delta